MRRPEDLVGGTLYPDASVRFCRDSLSRIAKSFGVTVSDLVSWNGISKQSTLRPGQKLTVNVRRH